MAVRVPVGFDPNTKKVEAALARIQAQAKGVQFGNGAKSIEKLSRPLGKITGQASEFQKSLEASNARVLAFGASVAVINKLSQAFGALVSNTIKVEASFAKINTILGGTQKQLEQFGNGIFKVAQNTATSFDQVAEGALELARQGLSVEESLSRVETALKLVRVAGIDSQQAVAGLTAAIKGFEGAGLNVAQIADKLAEVDTKFAVSTEDLINGLERASASARVAGVSFDELLGVITTVQERTQRGGAVIGNAFKTIFARLGRTDTLQALEDLGISTTDASGNVRSAIPLFQELATELDKLGLKSIEAGEIIQKVAGVRQRDILISLVEDLNSGQSQFAKALQVSAGAAGSLDRKNAQLNDTLEALINNLTVGAQKLSAVIGELGFTDAAKDILAVFSAVVNGITDLLQGDSMGAKFAQGIVKGIGSILTGPGLALISAIFVKLFIDLAKFGVTSLKSLLGINKASEQQGLLQKSIFQTLLQNEAIQKEILLLEGNKVAQEQLLLKIYNQQAAALARVQKAASTVSPGLFNRGFRGGEGGVGKTGRGAGGYVAAEARDVSRGVGGAPASSKVVSIPNFAFGGGKRGTMVANSSEYFVPNYAGGGDAIFNRDMVRSSGLPSGAKKINAASGFIPNFVRPSISISKNPNVTTADQARKAGYSDSQISNAFGAQGKREKSRTAAKSKKQKSSYNFDSLGKIGVLSAFARDGSSIANTTFKDLSPREKAALESLVGADITKPSTAISVRGIQNQSLENLDKSKVSNFRKNIDTTFAPALIDFAKTLIGGVGIKNDEMSSFVSKVGGAKGNLFSTSVEGGIFESAIQLGTKKLREIPAFLSAGGNERSPFDFEEAGNASQNLIDAFRFDDKLLKADAKRSSTSTAVASLIGKSLRDGIAKKFKKSAAGGYIPNFADGGLEDAIGREQAAGVPINQIRINQSGKLRNSKNPGGLAITNTRDEPTGRIPNFFQGRIPNFFQKGQGIGILTPGEQLRRNGPIANSGSIRGNLDISKTTEGLDGAFDSTVGRLFALQLGVSALSSTFAESGGKVSQFTDGLNSAINTMLVVSAIGANPLGGFGGKSITKLVAGTTGLSRAFALMKGLLGPIALGLTALDIGLKLFFGKGILGFAKDAMVTFGLTASEAASKMAAAAEDFATRTAGKDAGESTDVAFSDIDRQLAAVKAGVAVEDVTQSNIDFGSISTLRSGTKVGENKGLTGKFVDEIFLEEEDLKPIRDALGNLIFTSAEELKKKIPGISDEAAEGFLKSQKEIFGNLDAQVTNFVSKNRGSTFKDIGANIGNFTEEARLSQLNLFDRTQREAPPVPKGPPPLADGNISIGSGLLETRKAFSKSGSKIKTDAGTKNLEDELALTKDITEAEKNRLQNQIDLRNLESEAALVRNESLKGIVEEAVESKVIVGVNKEKLASILSQVTAETDLVALTREAATTLGLSDEAMADIVLKAQESLSLSNDDLETKKALLENDKERKDALAEINDALETANRIQNASNNKSSNKFRGIQATEQDATRGRKLTLDSGAVGSGEARRIESLNKISSLTTELAGLRKASSDAEAAAIKANAAFETDKNSKTLADAKTQADLDETFHAGRLENLEEIIEKEKQLAEFRGNQSGFSLGLEDLDTGILSFEDKLGREIPGLFANNLGTAMKEAVSGAEDIGDALSKAGETFLGHIRDAFLQQAADQFTSSLMGGMGGGGSPGTGGGLVGGLFDGVKGFFGGGKGAEGAAATAAGGAAGAAEGEKKGGIGGFFSGLFGGGKKGAALGSTPATPMYVSDVSLSKGGAEGVLETITGDKKGAEGEEGKGFLGGLTDKLGGFFDGFKDKMGGLFDGIKGLFNGGQGGGGGGIGGMLTNLFTGGGGGGGGIFGTIMGAFGFANGGAVGFANGGPVGSTDTVPAMLTPGEFVVKKSAVDKYGAGFLSSLNNGVLPMQGFQNGGSVSPVAAEAGNSAMGGNQVSNTSDFTFNIQEGKVEQGSSQSSSEQQKEFAARVRSAVTTTIQEESRTGGSLNYLYKG